MGQKEQQPEHPDMAALGARGGRKTRRRKGKKFFREIAKASWPRTGASKGGRPLGSKNRPKPEVPE